MCTLDIWELIILTRLMIIDLYMIVTSFYTLQLLNWVSQESEKDDKVLITGLEGPLSKSDFNSEHSEEKISTILVKPHRDAVQKLSIEYARLVRENERLRGIINSAINILDDTHEKEQKTGVNSMNNEDKTVLK